MSALKFLITLLICASFTSSAWAARVAAVKGRKILINTEGDDINKGEIYYLISKRGKKRGIVKILKIKGNKAIAKMSRKSKARKSWTLRLKRTRKKTRSARVSESMDESSSSNSKMHWGALLGFSMNKMDVANIGQASNDQTSMSGTGFSAKGILDYKMFSSISFRAMLGVEQFNTSSDDDFCTPDNGQSFGNTICETEIMYGSGGIWGRWHLPFMHSLGPWLGGGLSLQFPFSKKSTTVKEDTIKSTSVFAFGGGLDWQFGPKYSVPIQFEYQLFPSSDDTKTSAIAIRAGLRLPF